MILTQDMFVCKPGNAGKLAKLFKESMMGVDPHLKYVLTDMTGQYHRIIMISEYNDLAEYEENWKQMANPSPEMKEAMKKMEGINMNEMYVSGSREILKVW